MRMRLQILALLAVLTAGISQAEHVIVTGARVNLRATAGMNGKIVSMATQGERLKAKSISAEWVEVEPPPGLEFWLHSDFVENDRVVGAEVNVRSGPSIRDVTLARLPRGSRLTVRRHSGDWLLIAPPSGISLWISRSLVEREGERRIVSEAPSRVAVPKPVVKKPVVAKPAVKKPVSAQQVVVKPAPVRPAPGRTVAVTRSVTRVTRPSPAAAVAPVYQPAPRRAPTIRDAPDVAAPAGTGYEGIVQKAARTLHEPSPYRLVRRLRGRSETICYLRGNNASLEQWVGHSVRVHGQTSGTQGVREPVLDVTHLHAN